jgi:hypothetical protein
MSMSDTHYWFPAKRYGWGWGFPTAWQGWAVLIAWLAALLLGIRELTPRRSVSHVAFVAAMVLLLTIICYWKGEPPRWRWGDSDR